jgi:hypothetical protein
MHFQFGVLLRFFIRKKQRLSRGLSRENKVFIITTLFVWFLIILCSGVIVTFSVSTIIPSIYDSFAFQVILNPFQWTSNFITILALLRLFHYLGLKKRKEHRAASISHLCRAALPYRQRPPASPPYSGTRKTNHRPIFQPVE